MYMYMPYLSEGYELEKKDTPGQVVDLSSMLKQQNTLDFVLVGMYMYVYMCMCTNVYVHVLCCKWSSTFTGCAFMDMY